MTSATHTTITKNATFLYEKYRKLLQELQSSFPLILALMIFFHRASWTHALCLLFHKVFEITLAVLL